MHRSTHWQLYSGALDSALCDLLLKHGEQLCLQEAEVANAQGSFSVRQELRRTNIGFFQETHWVTGLINHYVSMANRDLWQFEINAVQGVQFASYAQHQHYDWHKDEHDHPFGDDWPQWRGLNRKLSACVNLSSPDDYTGGELEIKDSVGEPQVLHDFRPRGSVIVFPAYVLHRVTPVTTGCRKSLVLWALGPSFK